MLRLIRRPFSRFVCKKTILVFLLALCLVYILRIYYSCSNILTVHFHDHILSGRTSHLRPLDHQLSCPCQTPLLTLFTTFKPVSSKISLYQITLRNWATMQPCIVPILYSDSVNSTFLVAEAAKLNWTVYPAPELWDGLPVLKAMYSHAMEHSSTPFYGYANGDILFTEDLLQTLCFIRQHVNWTQYLITGRRTNSNYTGQPLDTLGDIKSLAQNGTLFFPNSEDFFITGVSSYPWSEIPRFVVGRLAYDNWLVANAINEKIPVIDVTETVLSLHLTDFEGKEAGRYSINKTDLKRNVNLADPNFYFPLGSVTCAPYQTRWNVFKNVQLYFRTLSDPNCLRALRRSKQFNITLFWMYWSKMCTICRFHS